MNEEWKQIQTKRMEGIMTRKEEQTCYSYDGDTFYVDPSGFEEVRFIGKAVWGKHSDFFNTHSIVEDMQDTAVDVAGDFAETYLTDLDDKVVDGLHEVICKYMEQNFPSPLFFTVKDVVEVGPCDPIL